MSDSFAIISQGRGIVKGFLKKYQKKMEMMENLAGLQTVALQ